MWRCGNVYFYCTKCLPPCWLVCHVTACVWNRQRGGWSERLSGQHGEDNMVSLRLVSYYLLMMTLYFQDSNFLSATGLLTGSVKRFSTMVRSGRDNRRILCYVSMGLVLVFFLLYYLISRIQQWLQLLTSAAQEDFYFVKQRASAQRKTHEEPTGRTNLLQLADEAWTYELFVTATLVHTSYYHSNISKVTVV